MGALKTIGDREWFVYTLSDPRTGDVRYVGWTIDIARRLYLHIWHSSRHKEKNTYKAKWIQSLLKVGVDPAIQVIESGRGDGWKESEPKWISHFKSLGCKLTNLTDGGQGTIGIVVKESTKKLIGDFHRGKGFWKKGIAAAIESNRGKKLPPEHVAKVAGANRGKKRSPEFCASIVKRNTGRVATPETRARLSVSHSGLKRTEEQRKTLSAAQFKRWADARQSISPGADMPWAGQKRTPEQVERIKRNRYPGYYEKKAEIEAAQGKLF